MNTNIGSESVSGELGMIASEFEIFRQAVISPNAPKVQIDEMRMAFFAGASACFYKLLTGLEDGDDATDSDFSLLNKLQDEMKNFGFEYVLRNAQPVGERQ